MRGVPEITIFARKLVGDPDLPERCVREWIAKKRFRVKRWGRLIVTTKTAMREDFTRMDDPVAASPTAPEAPALAAADATEK
jgi:hypothetical protein